METMTAPQSSAPNKDKLTVFYDGSCPLCAREVAFYQQLRGADGVEWQDVSECEAEEVQPGLSAHPGRFSAACPPRANPTAALAA